MCYIEIINQLFELFYQIGIWHRGDEVTVKETMIKIIYLIFYALFPIFLISGAITIENRDESIFLTLATITSALIEVKLFYLLWKKNDILELVNKVGHYTMDNQNDFVSIEDKLNSFMKVMKMIIVITFTAAVSAAIIVPFLGSERKLFFNIWFPLDWKNNLMAFWIACVFNLVEAILCCMGFFFSILMWYLLFNCALKLKVLGNEMKNLGASRTSIAVDVNNASEKEKQKLFYRDFIATLKSHKKLKEDTEQVELFFSKYIALQTATGAISICGMTYSLAFNHNENLVESILYVTGLFYIFCDNFLVMYFGDEIKCSSKRLLYCMFESNWIDQPKQCKKLIIIFAELLKQPHQIIILKLYPLTLETFTRILNVSYSMFNILQSLA